MKIFYLSKGLIIFSLADNNILSEILLFLTPVYRWPLPVLTTENKESTYPIMVNVPPFLHLISVQIPLLKYTLPWWILFMTPTFVMTCCVRLDHQLVWYQSTSILILRPQIRVFFCIFRTKVLMVLYNRK